MCECEYIADLLPEYISGGLERQQKNELVWHIKSCAQCRAEFALWIAVKHSLVPVASNEYPAMFGKLPEKETAFDTVRDVFTVVKKSLKLIRILEGGH